MQDQANVVKALLALLNESKFEVNPQGAAKIVQIMAAGQQLLNELDKGKEDGEVGTE
jgi:predicted RNA binding protein with dsRBD fold (UPF0201 family)